MTTIFPKILAGLLFSSVFLTRTPVWAESGAGSSAYSQVSKTPTTDSTGTIPVRPTLPVDSGHLAGPDTKAPQDSLHKPKSRADSVVVVKHGFNHREQIIGGSVIMACLVLALVTMNNYNPR